MSPLRTFPTFNLALCLTLALSTAFAPSIGIAQEAAARPAAKASAADSSVNLEYVVPSAVVVLIAKPEQILKSSAAELFPIEVLQAALLQETGLDPLEANELVVSVSPPIAGPPSYSLLATFNDDIALKTEQLSRHTEKTTLAGKEYFKGKTPDPMEPSLFRPSAKQLLIGQDATLTRLVESVAGGNEGGAGAKAVQLPLTKAAAASFQNDDLLLMVDAATLRPFIGMGLMQAKLPPELGALRQIPNLVKLIELRVNVSHSGPTELTLTANDKADADKIVEIYNGIRQAFSDKIAEQARQALASDDPIQQATGRYTQRMQKKFEAGPGLTQEGDRIVLLRADLTKSEGNELVYVATIGTLVGLLLPAVQAAREAARRNQSMNNMKQLMLSLHNFHDVKNGFPAYANVDADGKPLLSWRVHILPYLEEQALYEQFHLDEPWDSEHNKKLVAKMPEVFLDPSSGLVVADGKTNYLGVKGEGYFFNGSGPDGKGRGRHMKMMTDGTSNSIALVQVHDEAAVPWTKPEDWTPSESDLTKPLHGPHPGGFLAGFCDGHIQFISTSIDPKMLRALLTISGEEVVELQ